MAIVNVIGRMPNSEAPQTEIAKYIRGLDCGAIGDAVYRESISKSILNAITAICRRRFKKNEVILFVDLGTDDDYENGVVFTEEKIFIWTDEGRSVTEIMYTGINNVDFDKEGVIIEYDETQAVIDYSDYDSDENYPRAMYSFIMDILDYFD